MEFSKSDPSIPNKSRNPGTLNSGNPQSQNQIEFLERFLQNLQIPRISLKNHRDPNLQFSSFSPKPTPKLQSTDLIPDPKTGNPAPEK